LPAAGVAAEAHYLLGLAYEAQSQSVPAVKALSEALRLDGKAAWAADAQVRLAWLYLDQKQAGSAEQAARAALATHAEPEADRQARLALVQALVDQQKWDPALAESQTLLAASPPAEVVATVLYTQAWIHGQRGKPEEALPLWERLAREFEKSPHAADALLRLGDAGLKAERFEEARARYAALIAGHPQSPLVPETRFKLGSALFNLQKYADAAAAFDAAAAERGAGELLPEALYWAGVALDKAERQPEAIQRLTRLVQQFPKHARTANARICLAALKAVQGK
jgi:TolA-binding protein